MSGFPRPIALLVAGRGRGVEGGRRGATAHPASPVPVRPVRYPPPGSAWRRSQRSGRLSAAWAASIVASAGAFAPTRASAAALRATFSKPEGRSRLHSPISPLARSAVSKAPAAARQFLPPPQPPLPPAPATGSPPPPPPPPLRRNWLGPAWQHRLKHSHAKHHIWMDIGAGPDKSRGRVGRPSHPARWMRMNQRSAAPRANLFGSRRNSSPCLTRLGDLVRPGNGRNPQGPPHPCRSRPLSASVEAKLCSVMVQNP